MHAENNDVVGDSDDQYALFTELIRLAHVIASRQRRKPSIVTTATAEAMTVTMPYMRTI